MRSNRIPVRDTKSWTGVGTEVSIFYVGSYAQLPCRQISRMIWQKRRKKSREMPLFLFYNIFWIFTRASFEGHTPHAQAGQRRAPLARPEPTHNSVERTRVKDASHRSYRAYAEHHAPRARRDESPRTMTVRAFEIAPARTRDTPRGLSWRGRAGSPARRVPRRALTRDTMRAEWVSRTRARTPRSRLARTRVRRTRTTDASRPRSPTFLTAERRQPTRPAGFSRRSGSDEGSLERPIPQAVRPARSSAPVAAAPRALARSGARAHASPPAHRGA